MLETREVLSQALVLIRQNQMAQADELLRKVIKEISRSDLLVAQPILLEAVEEFYPKRRKALRALIRQKIEDPRSDESSNNKSLSYLSNSYVKPNRHITGKDNLPVSLKEYSDELRKRFDELSERHIFQWTTYYRDAVRWAFQSAQALWIRNSEASDNCEKLLRSLFSSHAAEIFGKGYRFVTSSSDERVASHGAHLKAINGLQRFLELPVEAYTAELSPDMPPEYYHRLRAICSSVISGILSGFCNTRFSTLTGKGILPRYSRAWAHYLPFLQQTDLEYLLLNIEEGPFASGLRNLLLPVLSALDQQFSMSQVQVATLPTTGQYDHNLQKFSISLLLPSAVKERSALEIQCYVDQSTISQSVLRDGVNRGADIILAPIRADIASVVDRDPLLRPVVVNTQSWSALPAASGIMFGLLSSRMNVILNRERASSVLTTNFPAAFPLSNPILQKYFMVHRRAVKHLLQQFEFQTGARLWCSVRRSGKTTACLDLGSSITNNYVVTQTCEATDRYPNAAVLYEGVKAAIEDRKAIPSNYIETCLSTVLPVRATEDSKIILILDEYETLFDDLSQSCEADKLIRYRVAQPLLNQFVAFAASNLLIFIGQRPDAHYILMDQNQLSPCITQDHFPLFQHVDGDINSEFSLFVKKVCTERVEYNVSLTDAVYAETGGHPYLSVNLLVEFFNWLIAQKRSLSPALSSEDYSAFSETCLRPAVLRASPNYRTMLKLAEQSLNSLCRSYSPWLFAVFQILNTIGRRSPKDLCCTKTDLEWDLRQLNIPSGQLCSNLDYLLSTAEESNFLKLDDELVSPRIPLLTRLASAIPQG